MAKSFVFTDDIDGSQNAETVTFSFQGTTYEIDLNKRNRDALAKALKPYIDNGRKARGGTGTARVGRTAAKKSSSADLQSMREWARANGFAHVSDRGRVSRDIQEAYHAAQ
ncbi:Lsr2 family protein [Jatrophihabitans telluris]|uniref:Lsr2 family protein n=1 Tax=Jatrophihabitans telluris TaxID=2038343 RepID=A0ABY4R1A6_9ACTN|nr:Lsr2 family protein [Jatrophihabitans telluris]UQX89500.1 Lsr2 family protein [Jatrophihabitans telluris]